MNVVLARVLRMGSHEARDVRTDLWWLIGCALLLIATGIGWRDPWPADEPRFALVARDMMLSGEWLIPQVGADLYADKPPLYFWLMAICIAITRSMRAGFLLPSLLSAVGCVVLVYDLGRRLWNRETGLIAALTLLVCVQFVWQARQAQIDATLCFWTTLSLYALLRHCLLGPAWGWYAVGWAAAGFGIITKGVGFMPLLVLVPFALLRRGAWTPQVQFAGAVRWLLGPVALLAAVSLWLIPLLIAAHGDPQIAAYRDEILFRQTIDRYASAWHHREPFWYFFVEVIPWLWLPLTALVPWLWPHWRAAWRARDLRVVLPLLWTLTVVVFFSLSTGKRGVYVLPGLPGLVLAAAPAMAQIALNRRAQRTLFVIVCLLAGVCCAAAIYLLINAAIRLRLIEQYDLDAVWPLLAIGGLASLGCVLARKTRGFIAYPIAIAGTLLIVSFWINPLINEARSSAQFIGKVEAQAAALGADRELAFVAYKEQYLLYITRPIVNFGHARWQEREQEAADAGAWLAADSRRLLLVDDALRKLCFAASEAHPVGIANRLSWSVVTGSADPVCAAKGHLAAARTYRRGSARRGLAPRRTHSLMSRLTHAYAST